MRVKKFEASSVIEALQQVKAELGPDAIIIQTKEEKSRMGQAPKFVVVAAVSEQHLRKKELAEKKLGDIYTNKVSAKTAQQQKAVIENVYQKLEKKMEQKNKTITARRYIDIDDAEEAPAVEAAAPVSTPVKEKVEPLETLNSIVADKLSSAERVKNAAQAAFKSSLTSDFFKTEVKEEVKEEEAIRSLEIPSITPSVKPVPTLPRALLAMADRLKACGVEDMIVRKAMQEAYNDLGKGSERRALVDSWFARWILDLMNVAPVSEANGVEIFVGPHGAGKTTALLKLATQYVVQQRKSVAIITTDIHKVGAIEQLKVYSRILNIPLYIARDLRDLEDHIEQLDSFDSILVDTPGISLGSMEELDFMRAISQMSISKARRTHLTLSALAKSNDLVSIIKRFRVAQFDDVIISNVDQTTQHGILLNIQSKIPVAYHSFGIGSDIVDGFEYASRERVLDLIFKLTKMNGEKAHGDTV